MRRYWQLWLILAAYLGVGGLYAVYTPPWQAPDEPAHYNYVRQLAGGDLPVIAPGDYDQAYQAQVITSRFAPEYSVTPFSYEDHQPPLYYLLQLPVYLVSGGALLAMRLLSLLLGAGVAVLVYIIGTRLFPAYPWLPPTMTAFVAFLPQHVAMLAAVNNDSLAELLIAAILFRLISFSTSAYEPSRRAWLLLGLLLGLGFLTKATVYIMAPVAALVVLWRYWGDWRRVWRVGVWVFAPALFLGALWWGRNLFVYGGLDVLGAAAHDQVVVGQPRTSEWIRQYGWRYTLTAFLRTTFQSFWGQFGWMGVVMPSWVYQLLLLFSGLVALGWSFAWRAADRPRLPRPAVHILLGTFLLSVALYLGYNLAYVQHQGRYLFSALIPIAVAVALGVSACFSTLYRRWSFAPFLLPPLFAAAFLSLDLLALFCFILPQLTLP